EGEDVVTEAKGGASAALPAVSPLGVASVAATASGGAAEAATGPDRGQSRAAPSLYPLWSLPLRELTAERERPIFSATRRPPPPSQAAAPLSVPSPANEIARPPLSLLASIAPD